MEKTKKSFNLSLMGFNESQTRTFSAILCLAERGLRDSWRLIEGVGADFFILSTEKSESESLIVSKNLPRNRCIFCTKKHQPEYDYEHDVLFIASGDLPQLSSLVKVLNYQIANISDSEQSPTDNSSVTLFITPQIITLNNDDDFFNPNQSFLKRLLLQNTTDFLVYRFSSSTGSVKLYVDCVKKNYYCDVRLQDLKTYFTAKDAVIIDSISEIEWINTLKKITLPAHPLANLIWYVAFELSNGRLLSGHSNQDNVYLTRWPDLGVEGCGKYIKLAAFMRNNVASLTVTANKTNVPLTDVYSFYNACYLIGIVEKANNSELYAKVLDTEKQQLLTKITNRLKAINNPKEGAE